MNMQPKVSIIIPIYNAETTLHTCLLSVSNQTYNNLEIILVNDGSTDNSLQICYHFARQDERIKVITQTNLGPSAARNKGISHSTGRYIQFVDADDRLTKLMTETLIHQVTNSTDLVLCGYEVVNNKKSQVITPNIRGIFSLEQFCHYIGQLFAQQLLPSPCNKLYQTNIIKKNKLSFPIHLNFGEDLVFNMNYLKKCNQIAMTNESLYIYNNQPHSLSKQINENYFNEQLRLIEKVERFLRHQQTYTNKNKQALNIVFSQSVINTFSQLIDQSNSDRQAIEREINNLFLNKHIRHNLHLLTGSLQALLIKKLITFNLKNTTYVYLKLKHVMKQRTKGLYHIFKKINEQSKA